MTELQIIALISITIGIICMIVIVIDLLRGNQQHMMIMNFVYPITALYAGPLALWVYFTVGRKSTHKAKMAMKQKEHSHHKQKPFWQSVVVGALHCGSGCTIGDLISESILLAFPLTILGHAMFGAWVVDYFFAFVIGILFQYYSIKPMKGLSPKEGLKAAVKADSLSLTSWQVGMYGWMAIATFLVFKHELKADTLQFWFMMQIAMLFGFLTAYPVNWWLLEKKIKEPM